MSGTTSSQTIEISKIQLRRGESGDLPGAPSPGNPTFPSTPLDTGEIAFTTDTGQLFIGPDLTSAGQTQNRTFFPYQNIEVLTENSTKYLSNLFDYFYRDVRTGFYISSPLTPTTNDQWATLYSNNGTNKLPCIISNDVNLACVQINYYLYDQNSVVRTGTLSCIYTGNANPPAVVDDYVTYQNTASNVVDPTILYGDIQFSASVVANGDVSNVVLQYQNNGTTMPLMYFKLERGGPVPEFNINPSNPLQNAEKAYSCQLANSSIIVDTWNPVTTMGIAQYYVLSNLIAPNSGTQIDILYVGTDGNNVNYVATNVYLSPNLTTKFISYSTSISNNSVNLSAMTNTVSTYANMTLLRFPVYATS